MSLVKVNLMSEAMEALALEPFKRLFLQRKQENYKQATSEYSTRLRQLYFAHSSRRLQAKRRFKLTLESAILQLEVTDLHPEKLHGITIERSSLPGAEPNDQVQLINCQQESTKNPQQQVIARGHVQSATSSELKIKLVEPLVLREKVTTIEPAEGAKGVEQVVGEGESSEQQQGDDQTKGREEPKGEDEQVSGAQAEAGAETIETPPGPKIERIIVFKIKFVPTTGEQQDQIDELNRLVDNMLIRFNDLKCNQWIHKNLLGLYDERSDLIYERARVMTFDELPVKAKGQQLLAIEQSIKRRVSLIEGPAGSGKTLVAAHLAANMARLKRAKVLICSPVWTNVSKLAEMISHIDGIQVVKLPANWHPHSKHNAHKDGGDDDDDDSDCSTKTQDSLDLDKLVKGEIYLQAWNRSKETLHNHHESLRAHAHRMVSSCSTHRRREVEAKIIGRANVVCCTNLQAAALNSLATPVEFDMLILDDVQATSELDCLAPIMTRGIKQVTLLSDTRRRIRLARSLKLSSLSSSRVPNGIATQQANGNSSVLTHQNGHNHDNNNSTLLLNNRQTSSLRRKPSSLSLSGGGGSRRGGSTRRKASRPASQLITSSDRSSLIESVAPDQLPGGLFERLLAIGLPTVDFRFQFRMHQTLSNFTNHHFYLGRLKDDPQTNAKMEAEINTSLVLEDKPHHFDWLPNRKYLTALYAMSTAGPPSTSSSSSSSTLDLTKLMIEKLDYIIQKLTGPSNENIQESRIGVIFNRPVDPQVEWMKKLFRSSASKIKHGTISDFIGQERDFIILVALPAPADNSADWAYQLEWLAYQQQMSSLCSEIPCDFKADDSALNCALTRAKLGMFLLASITDDVTLLSNGNGSCNEDDGEQIALFQQSTCDNCKGWLDMISYYNQSGLTVTQ